MTQKEPGSFDVPPGSGRPSAADPVYLPVMLDCRGRRCLVVGGGPVAQRRISGLLEAGAAVELISPGTTPELERQAAAGSLKWRRREYAPGDCAGAWLVYAATNQAAVNEAVAAEATALGVPVNVASRGEAGTFLTPSVIRRGLLTVAVSASGAGPGAAAQVKELLEETLGGEYGPYLEFLQAMRAKVKRLVPLPGQRAELLRELGGLDVLEQIRAGTFIPWSEEEMELWITERKSRHEP